MTEDPIGFAGGDENLARYVSNHPVHSTDPTGLQIQNPTPVERLFYENVYLKRKHEFEAELKFLSVKECERKDLTMRFVWALKYTGQTPTVKGGQAKLEAIEAEILKILKKNQGYVVNPYVLRDYVEKLTDLCDKSTVVESSTKTIYGIEERFAVPQSVVEEAIIAAKVNWGSYAKKLTWVVIDTYSERIDYKRFGAR